MTELGDAPAPRRLHARRRGMAHDELGLAFCELWGLPSEISLPIRYHHHPSMAPSAARDAALIASAAESIADLHTSLEVAPVLGLAEQALSNLNLHGVLPKLVERVADYVDDTAEAFGIDAVPELRFAEICERSRATKHSASKLARVREEPACVRRAGASRGVMELDCNRLRRQVR
jgi:hypothetical protein